METNFISLVLCIHLRKKEQTQERFAVCLMITIAKDSHGLSQCALLLLINYTKQTIIASLPLTLAYNKHNHLEAALEGRKENI